MNKKSREITIEEVDLKRKLCLAISVYDKYQDLENCVNSARLNGISNIFVFAPSDAKISRLQAICNQLEIELTVVETGRYSTTNSKAEFYRMITPRVWDLQRAAVNKLKDEFYFIIHTHSDGWILSDKFVENIIQIIKNNSEIVFIYRGVGNRYKNIIGSPLGSIDDHFYVIKLHNNPYIDFFHRTYGDFALDTLNIHGILSLFAYVICKKNEQLHYDDTKSWLEWDGQQRDYSVANPLRPFVYNKELGLLHCHNDDFPGYLGEALQESIWLENSLPKSDLLLSSEARHQDYIKYKKRYIRMKKVLVTLGLHRNRFGYYHALEEDFKEIYKRPWKIPLIFMEKLLRSLLKAVKLRLVVDERIRK